jgi:hypothetical protein
LEQVSDEEAITVSDAQAMLRDIRLAFNEQVASVWVALDSLLVSLNGIDLSGGTDLDHTSPPLAPQSTCAHQPWPPDHHCVAGPHASSGDAPPVVLDLTLAFDALQQSHDALLSELTKAHERRSIELGRTSVEIRVRSA